jgi:PKD repeat protein/C1A family cysteine protease
MTKKLIILSELLVLFLIIGSSIAMAYTEFSGEDKSVAIQKNIANPMESSPKLKFAPLSSTFLEYKNRTNLNLNQGLKSSSMHGTGSIPSPVDLSYVKSSSYPNLAATLPSSYDLRTSPGYNKVSSVKDQDPTGTCWDFATYGSLESDLMPAYNYYFSEQNMRNLLSSNYQNGFDRGPWDGGNEFMSTAYLARLSGPVNNSDDPWNVYLNTSSTTLPIQQHVQNVTILPMRANSSDMSGITLIKQAILNYGAGVATSINMPQIPPYWNSITNSEYYNGAATTDHVVTIVGWNDNYSMNNFSIIPPGNGAFIVKNSWGTGWGDQGYFYMSYYDTSLDTIDNPFVFTSEPLTNYKNIYQHDPLGWTKLVAYGTGSTDTLFGASVFTANSNEILKAISFYSPTSSTSYVIKIYTNTGSNPPLGTSGPIVTQSGTISRLGYVTVPLTSGVNLISGQTFSVVIQLTTPGDDYPMSVSTPISGYSSHATATAGESFLSADGISWSDLTSLAANTTLNIKAFTNSATSPTAPVAKYSVNTTTGPAPLSVQFTDQSTGSPTSWLWNFGDGTSSTQENPVHSYNTVGTYWPSLTASNAYGSSQLSDVSIIVTSPPSSPVAQFSANPITGTVPLSVQCTDQSTGSPTSWYWDFGDGTTSNLQNPSYVYNTAGYYLVEMAASNQNGQSAPITGLQIIANAVTTMPDAHFRINQTAGPVPLDVQFTDKTTGSPTSWNWDFGDGTTSTLQNPEHIYSTAGIYTPTLTASNAVGSSTKASTVPITAMSMPDAHFRINPTQGPIPLTVQFTDKTTGEPTSWYWDFGDGTNSTLQNPVHSYNTAGIYTPILTASNVVGASTKISTVPIIVT